jgi:hypothetical protein
VDPGPEYPILKKPWLESYNTLLFCDSLQDLGNKREKHEKYPKMYLYYGITPVQSAYKSVITLCSKQKKILLHNISLRIAKIPIKY